MYGTLRKGGWNATPAIYICLYVKMLSLIQIGEFTNYDKIYYMVIPGRCINCCHHDRFRVMVMVCWRGRRASIAHIAEQMYYYHWYYRFSQYLAFRYEIYCPGPSTTRRWAMRYKKWCLIYNSKITMGTHSSQVEKGIYYCIVLNTAPNVVCSYRIDVCQIVSICIHQYAY